MLKMKFKMPGKNNLFSNSLVTLFIMFSIICIAVLSSTQLINSYLESEALSSFSNSKKGYFKNFADESKDINQSKIVFLFTSEETWAKNLSNGHILIDNKVCKSALHQGVINVSICSFHDKSGSNYYDCVCRSVHDDICSSKSNYFLWIFSTDL
ncbi:TPA: hypothetical protein ACHTOV_003704 [Enterobacter cancerogenus]|uniref:hypothetical protein n=1 Tax=Enterobacter cancerogenus TaxID=69218 RepID=UPI0012995469|nr:hypothetical protein [Enterobacter cancerogenus]MRG34123.1 hypothetical protein [Enterobacter cancerogenus]QZY39536.1 hypothetical protein HU826_24460 [Enterobacter cancerogenus]